MSKVQVSVKLTGMLENGVKAKTQQAKEVCVFTGIDTRVGNVTVNVTNPEKPVLITKAGGFPLKKHTSQNYWVIEDKKCPRKVHVILKKITGEIIYWA